MLAFFRRIISSRVGIVVTFGVLVLIAILFGLGDITGLRGGGGVAQDSVASVGGEPVATAEARDHVQTEFQAAQGQQPTLTLAQFVAAGGVDGTIERTISGLALAAFGRAQGMVVSKRAVDGQIASIPSLQGPTGQFDPKIYQGLLQARHLTDDQVRADLARDTLSQQLLAPTIGASQVADQFVLPYASLLLEKRQGLIGFIPAKAMAGGPAPTDAELQAFYARHRDRYLMPERRVIRYALVTPASVAVQAVPTDAELAKAYAATRAQYEPTEKRTVTQVSVLDQTAATQLAAKVKGGTSIDAAARAAGLAPRTLTAVTKVAYAAQASPAVADAVFAAAPGAIVGPLPGALGFVIAKVGAVEHVPGKTLDQARPELVKAVTTAKSAAALATVHDALDQALSNHRNFSEVTGAQHLSGQTTPPLTASGVNPDNAAAKPDPALTRLVAAAFQAEPGDDPQIVPTAQDGSFAVVALDRVVAAAPRPLAQVRAQVTSDVTAGRAQRAARALAGQVLAKANGGTPLAQALAAAGHSLPAPRPIAAVRAQLTGQQNPPPPLVLMFAMPPRTTRLLEAPGSGWYLIHLDTITPGDARTVPAAMAGARNDFRRLLGREYAEQFAHAVQAEVGVKRDPTAIAALKRELAGGGGSASDQ